MLVRRTAKKPITTEAAAATSGAPAKASGIGHPARSIRSAAPYAPRPNAAAWPKETIPPVPMRR